MKKFYITPIFLFLLFSCNYYSNKINHLQSDEYIDSIYESFDSLDKMKLKQINDSINILRIQMVLVHEKKSIERTPGQRAVGNHLGTSQLRRKHVAIDEAQNWGGTHPRTPRRSSKACLPIRSGCQRRPAR